MKYSGTFLIIKNQTLYLRQYIFIFFWQIFNVIHKENKMPLHISAKNMCAFIRGEAIRIYVGKTALVIVKFIFVPFRTKGGPPFLSYDNFIYFIILSISRAVTTSTFRWPVPVETPNISYWTLYMNI